jgi:hypothetical protein
MMQGRFKSMGCFKSSAARYCMPITTTAAGATSVATNITTTWTSNNNGGAASSRTYSNSRYINQNSLTPDIPKFTVEPDVLTIDAATLALYAQLPNDGEFDRGPADKRLMSGTGAESIVRFYIIYICIYIYVMSSTSSIDALDQVL